MELRDYRQELDVLDEQLTRLFVRRMELAGEIGELKKDKGLPILDREREREKLEQLLSLCPEKRRLELEALYGRIFELSR